MKSFDNLGKNLVREDQKKIKGGALPPFSDLNCKVNASDPGYTYVATYATNAQCHSQGFGAYCNGTGVPYEVCYCTGDTIIPAYCGF